MNRLPPGQQRAPQPKWTQGSIDRVPCPHCGKPNDFRELEMQQLLDTGHRVICRGENPGEGCGRLMEVAAIRVIKVIAVRPAMGIAPQNQRPVGEARTISPAQLQRYLKG
jgi:hypothetical protein